jgi:hypothetical protein
MSCKAEARFVALRVYLRSELGTPTRQRIKPDAVERVEVAERLRGLVRQPEQQKE